MENQQTHHVGLTAENWLLMVGCVHTLAALSDRTADMIEAGSSFMDTDPKLHKKGVKGIRDLSQRLTMIEESIVRIMENTGVEDIEHAEDLALVCVITTESTEEAMRQMTKYNIEQQRRDNGHGD